MSVLLGYVRVSGKAQAEKDGPERQELAIENFCRQNENSMPKIFSDLGVSGTVEGLDRPGFLALLESAEQMQATGVVVERLDRLARDLIVSEFLIRELRSRNLALFATDQGNQDLAKTDLDPSRKFIRQIFSAMAEYEKSALVVKLRVARDRKKKATGKCEGKRAFGEGESAEAKVERIMLNTILELRRYNEPANARTGRQASWNSIALMFAANGFKKRNGKTNWTGSQLWALWHRNKTRQNRKKKLNEHMLSSGLQSGVPAIIDSGQGV